MQIGQIGPSDNWVPKCARTRKSKDQADSANRIRESCSEEGTDKSVSSRIVLLQDRCRSTRDVLRSRTIRFREPINTIDTEQIRSEESNVMSYRPPRVDCNVTGYIF